MARFVSRKKKKILPQMLQRTLSVVMGGKQVTVHFYDKYISLILTTKLFK